MRRCKLCGETKESEVFAIVSGYLSNKCRECYKVQKNKKSAENYVKNREHRIKRMRRIYAEHKAAVQQHYGNCCACCGEKEPMFLSIDHIENNGAAHRHGNNNSSHNNIYGWLVRNKFPSGFQVLCVNCNQGKHRNGGVCPHVSKRQSLAA